MVPDYSIYSLFRHLIKHIKYLLVIPTVVVVITAFWSLTIPDTYLTEAVLSPTEEASGGGLSNLSGQLGGLASLAGISVGADSTDQVTVALEIIKSRQFIANFVDRHDIKVPLMASEEWDRENRQLKIDDDIYDTGSEVWTRPSINGRPSEPTALEVHEFFLQLLAVERDATSGLIKVSLEFYDPILARDWLLLLIDQLNSDMRVREITSTNQNIQYLENKVEQIGDIEMKTVFFQLIQEQTKKLMLAEVRSDFVFTTIDPPYVPELKFAPKRAIICVMAGFLSGFLVVAWFTFLFLVTPRR